METKGPKNMKFSHLANQILKDPNNPPIDGSSSEYRMMTKQFKNINKINEKNLKNNEKILQMQENHLNTYLSKPAREGIVPENKVINANYHYEPVKLEKWNSREKDIENLSILNRVQMSMNDKYQDPFTQLFNPNPKIPMRPDYGPEYAYPDRMGSYNISGGHNPYTPNPYFNQVHRDIQRDSSNFRDNNEYYPQQRIRGDYPMSNQHVINSIPMQRSYNMYDYPPRNDSIHLPPLKQSQISLPNLHPRDIQRDYYPTEDEMEDVRDNRLLHEFERQNKMIENLLRRLHKPDNDLEYDDKEKLMNKIKYLKKRIDYKDNTMMGALHLYPQQPMPRPQMPIPMQMPPMMQQQMPMYGQIPLHSNFPSRIKRRKDALYAKLVEGNDFEEKKKKKRDDYSSDEEYEEKKGRNRRSNASKSTKGKGKKGPAKSALKKPKAKEKLPETKVSSQKDLASIQHQEEALKEPSQEEIDVSDEEKRLKKLQAQRRLKMRLLGLFYTSQFQKDALKKISERREEAQKNLPDQSRNTQELLKNWLIKILQEKTFQPLIDDTKTDLNILPKGVMGQKKILNEKEERTRCEKIMGIIKGLLDSLVDGTKGESLGNNIIDYFGNISNNRKFLMQKFHFKFELDRLNFNSFGMLKGMEKNRSGMIIGFVVVVRVLILQILLNLDDAMNCKLNPIQENNVIIIAASLLNIFMEYVAKVCPVIPNNQNHLDKEIKTLPRDGPLTHGQSKVPLESKMESAKVVGDLPDKDMLAALLKKRSQWASMMMEIFNSWTEKTANIVEKLYGAED